MSMQAKANPIHGKTTDSPLRSPEALARATGKSPSWLHDVATNPDPHYSSFTRLKKGGGERIITPPDRTLRRIHSLILQNLPAHCPTFPRYVCGGLKGRSTRQHAEFHVNQNMVVTMDVEKFFPSTTTAQVAIALAAYFPEEMAEFLSGLCTHKNALPQGSPTSMFLSNLCFRRSDLKFRRHAKRHHLKYSRYVDDIAVSGPAPFRSHLDAFQSYIEESGYTVARAKPRSCLSEKSRW